MNKYGITSSLTIGEMHPLFRPILWVSAAAGDDDCRLALTHVHVEKSDMTYHIVATDGKRLHVSEMDPGMFDGDFDPLPPGDYEVLTRSAKRITLALPEVRVDYPNWRTIDRSADGPHEEQVFQKTLSKICMRTNKLLASDFVSDACGFGCGYKKDAAVSVKFGACCDLPAVVISHELGRAVIMAMEFGDYDDPEPKTDAEMTAEIPSIADHFSTGTPPE